MAHASTVVGLFHDMRDARAAVDELRASGIEASNISLVAAGSHDADSELARKDIATDVAADAGIGAALGGIGGLLLGFTALVIPGIGPVMAAGPLVAALSGAGVGAVAGGLIGGLNEAGVPQDEAKHYADRVSGGDVLLTVNASAADAERARDIMDGRGAADLDPQKTETISGPGSPAANIARTDNRVAGDPQKARTADVTGVNPGGEAMSADESRRAQARYGAAWPHKEAYDIGDSLSRKEVVEAEEEPFAFSASTRRARVYESGKRG